MKSLITFIATLILTTTAQAVDTDSVICTGMKSKLEISNARAVGGKQFVSIKVWSREAERLVEPDLFKNGASGSDNSDVTSVDEALENLVIEASNPYQGEFAFDTNTNRMTITKNRKTVISEVMECQSYK